MTISTKDQLIAAKAGAQQLQMFKQGVRTTVANFWYSTIDLAGSQSGAALAGTSTTVAVKPDDTMAGYPSINAFGAGALGYLTQLEFSNTVACRMMLADNLWKAGAYSFGTSVAVTTSPSYSSRVPGGTDFSNCMPWFEAVTAFTGLPTITLTYTNQAGTSGKVSTTAITVAPPLGRMIPLNLAAGDTGVQSIQNVQCTVATAGTFNINVLRRLKDTRIRIGNDLVSFGPDQLMQQAFADSALVMLINADSTNSGTPEIMVEIANG